MPPLRGEYTTVSDVRLAYLGGTESKDDKLLLDLIRGASRDIDELSELTFYPKVETRYYDVPGSAPRAWLMNSKYTSKNDLILDAPLLELTTLTNGDGAAIASTQYLLEPFNTYPKDRLVLKRSSTVSWLPESDGDYERVIALAGIWGAHQDYDHAWDSLTAITAPITTSATTASVPTGYAKAGHLVRIESEFAYVKAVTLGVTNDTATLERGANGSTAAAHTTSSAVEVWQVPSNVELLCRQAAAAYYKLKSNPVGETVILDGAAVAKPTDVRKWLEQQLNREGIGRVVFG